MYEVPELIHPQIKKFITVSSYVNSSVRGLMPHKKIPTQKPMHIGQVQKYPAGLTFPKILP
tara:strand:- start:33 stop:215 length:183 start_codon:yes stop_codon:yes gene_type:complete